MHKKDTPIDQALDKTPQTYWGDMGGFLGMIYRVVYESYIMPMEKKLAEEKECLDKIEKRIDRLESDMRWRGGAL